MPLPTNHRNAILSQLSAAFDALEAGTLFEQDFIHQAFEFSTGGRTYIVALQPQGDANYAMISILVKRRPL